LVLPQLDPSRLFLLHQQLITLLRLSTGPPILLRGMGLRILPPGMPDQLILTRDLRQLVEEGEVRDVGSIRSTW
jgi:hypothetical protein